MNANRVSGPTPPEGKGHTPDTKAPGQDIRSKRLEKVKEVEETDPDARAKRFKQALDDAENQLEGAKSKRTPSPFEKAFYEAEEKAAPPPLRKPPLGSRETPPGPFYSPTPAISPPLSQPLPPSDEEEDSPLPKAPDFWNGIDEPPDQPLPRQNLQESAFSTTRGTQGKKGKEEEGIAPIKKGEDLPSFAAPFGKPEKKGKSPEKKGTSFGEQPLSSKEEGKPKQVSPFKRAVEEEFFEEIELPPSKEKFPGAQKKPKAAQAKAAPWEEEPSTRKKAAPSIPIPTSKKEQAMAEHLAERREKEEGDRQRQQRPIEIEGPSLPPLPPEIIPIATAAATQAAPYLSPETLSLYYQMVGTIYVMTSPPGISRTEIVLNAPSFANSRFFGATILIEKYATAPDSLNIRLSGSNEAVTAFNQNIPNLMAAFQNGNFSFRVNRIDTAYSSERPVFRRKEPGEGKKGPGGGRK